jgi:hypothetical protein
MALLDFITSKKPEDVERRLRLAQGIAGMAHSPNVGLQQSITGRLQDVQAQRQQQAALELAGAQRNKTAQWLASQGRSDLAQGIVNGSLSGAQAFELFKQKPTDKFEIITGDAAKSLGLDPNKSYRKNLTTNKVEAIGGAGVSVSVGGGEDTWTTEAAKLQAKRFDSIITAGDDAAKAATQVAVLNQLGNSLDQTTIPSMLRKFIPEGISAPVDAYKAVLYNAAMAQKTAGTGPMTDKDFENLLTQVGSIAADPQARQIAQTMLINNANIAMQMADIANQAVSGVITRTKADEMMRELRKRELIPEDMKQYLENIGASGGAQIPFSDIDAATAALEAAMKEKQKRQVGG